MEQNQEINLSEILRVIVKKIIWIILSAAIGFGVAFSFSNFFIAPKYTSSVKMYVNNVKNSESVNNAGITINDINASQKLVNTYIVILNDDEVIGKLLTQLESEFSSSQIEKYIGKAARSKQIESLRSLINMKSVDDTEVLQIAAETKNPEFSSRICTIMTEIAPDVLVRVVKAGSVEVIGNAEANHIKSSPNNTKNSLIGMFIGFIISIIAIIVIHLKDNTVKGEEDIIEKLEIPVLGEIPDINEVVKGGFKYGN